MTGLSRLGWTLLTVLFIYATYRALDGGGQDFSVFYSAWKLVLGGRGSEIFHGTPDRFLYAPGFAWCLAPLGLLPRALVLFIFCVVKFFALVQILRIVAEAQSGQKRSFPTGLYCFGVLIWTRPLLIDIQYGQVNTLILWISFLALVSAFSENRKNIWVWFLLGAFGVFKLLALPLMLLPWLRKGQVKQRWASMIGAMIALLAPFLTEGIGGGNSLLALWKSALLDRGLPLETHNQSLVAFMLRMLGGHESRIIALGGKPFTGWNFLLPQVIQGFALGWALFIGIAILGGMFWLKREKSPERRILGTSIICGLMILPSHLVWKPYFVFAIPAGIAGIGLVLENPNWKRAMLLTFIFAMVNLTSIEFLPPLWVGVLEAASILLWAHLILLSWEIGALKLRAKPSY